MKLMLPEGNLVPIPGVFPGMTPSSGATASSDLKEFVYRQPTTSSKLVMIENLLED
jgi:hypothetical protein